MRRAAALLGCLFVLLPATGAAARPLRAMGLDQCADQYLLALRPDADLALSPRADDPDAWLRTVAEGRRRVRPTLEAAVAFDPDVVVRYWGGEPRLLRRLSETGVRVAAIEDASDFNGVRRNIRTVAQALDAPARGEALIARMDARLAAAAPPPSSGGPRAGALYLTAGGFTAGSGTLVDAILAAAGFANLAPAPFFGPVSVERIALAPPARFVLGFFDQARGDWRGPGRHPVVRRAARERVAASLPAATLTCPAWFAADAAALLAERRP
ncbi:ABC transporter substrate-binding protein [Brevundimonas sp.]|uniref:ABC transporter substrate-binding protein n=1 Tax=Brevundimonas sp. TaxID=1871086 RepID=UPI0035AE2342